MGQSGGTPRPGLPAPAAAVGSTVAQSIPWLLIALVGHTSWGIYPVLGRYLQTVSHIPSMALMVVGYLPLAIVFMLWAWPRYGKVILSARTLWYFAVIVALRSVTNILASRYTLAIYVQLITLMTPFLIALLSTLVLRERMPKGTVPAMAISFTGSLLMISSEISGSGIHFSLTQNDWVGIGLALTSAVFLAFYMIPAGRTAGIQLSGLVVLLFQSMVIATTSAVLSLVFGEDWGAWARLGPSDWMAMAAFTGLVLLGGNWAQIVSLRKLGAPTVSSIMGWRLVSTLVVGMLMLGEGLTTLWQGVGMAIVLATVTVYLWGQARGVRQAQPRRA